MAIMVACMPACASFSRHFLTKYGVISTIRSRFSSSNEGSSKSVKPSATPIINSNILSETTEVGRKRSDGRYWSVDYAYSQDQGSDKAPQILPNKTQSRFIESGDLNVFENEKSVGRFSIASEQTAVEIGEPAFEKEKEKEKDHSATDPREMV